MWSFLCPAVPASIYKVSEDIIVNEGSNVTLTCFASGRPEPAISWRLLNPSGTNPPMGRVDLAGQWSPECFGTPVISFILSKTPLSKGQFRNTSAPSECGRALRLLRSVVELTWASSQTQNTNESPRRDRWGRSGRHFDATTEPR